MMIWFNRILTVCFAIGFFMGVQRPLFAYTDEIEANFEEVLIAAEQVLKPHGIHKSKPEKNYMIK
jgi:hypothetical protein